MVQYYKEKEMITRFIRKQLQVVNNGLVDEYGYLQLVRQCRRMTVLGEKSIKNQINNEVELFDLTIFGNKNSEDAVIIKVITPSKTGDAQ